jgi:hypothetical protein
MRNKRIYDYSDIASFEDFRVEKERLKLKRQIIEAKLNLEYLRIGNFFSVANLIIPFAKEYLLPKISAFIEILLGSYKADK